MFKCNVSLSFLSVKNVVMITRLILWIPNMLEGNCDIIEMFKSSCLYKQQQQIASFILSLQALFCFFIFTSCAYSALSSQVCKTPKIQLQEFITFHYKITLIYQNILFSLHCPTKKICHKKVPLLKHTSSFS